jgi:hypothetical protein
MNTAILHSPKKNTVDDSEVRINKPALVKSIKSSNTVTANQTVNQAVNSEAQTYTFVGIAG